MMLQFDVSAITGYTPTSGNTGYEAYFVPAFWFFSKIELLMNGQIVDTYYGDINSFSYFTKDVMIYYLERLYNEFGYKLNKKRYRFNRYVW